MTRLFNAFFFSIFQVESNDSIRGCPSVDRSVGWSVRNAFVSAGRDQPVNDLFCIYKLVFIVLMLFVSIVLHYQHPIYFTTDFAFFTKWLKTYQWTDKTIDRWTSGQTHPFIVIQWTHLKMTTLRNFRKNITDWQSKLQTITHWRSDKWTNGRTNALQRMDILL